MTKAFFIGFFAFFTIKSQKILDIKGNEVYNFIYKRKRGFDYGLKTQYGILQQ